MCSRLCFIDQLLIVLIVIVITVATKQQHVRGRQKGHTSIFSQHHSNNGRLKTNMLRISRRRHIIKYDFICKSYPNKKGILNDDYCDCPDGSDEPHTSACSHWLVGQWKFACNNNNNNNGMSEDGRNHDGSMTYVFTSWVKDGIVDCPSSNADEVWWYVMWRKMNYNQQTESLSGMEGKWFILYALQHENTAIDWM